MYFITGNKNKLKEAQEILGSSLENTALDLLEIQGSEEEIARHKALEAYSKVSKPVFVEDVSIKIESMDGLPGPYIKYFLEAMGAKKIAAICSGSQAQAICTIGYAESKDRVHIFQGVIQGRIVEPRGESGFGFDPIFEPDGYDKTFAQMSIQEKNAISHRKLAIQKLKDYVCQARA